jgi:NAD(P)-dependent dehydrogenase (short-subunit alcohol dehydrogenase family)
MGTKTNLFDLSGKVAVIIGGGGILGEAMARGLGVAGAKIGICDILPDKAKEVANALGKDGIEAKTYMIDVLKKEEIQKCCDAVYADFKKVDILVNAAGGNMKAATTSKELSFFDLPFEPLQKVIALNLFGGAILPCQVFGRKMVENKDGGSIINISSMNAFRPLTRVPGYSAAKAAVSNFTQWLAVHLAQEYNKKLRVNAIAPGFFLTDQNRYLLTDEKTGKLTQRGELIIAHTPAGEFGTPDDLIGATIWLASGASRFVSGIVVPVDGGFSAFSGV